MPYLQSLDIGNRALQHCGAEPILDVAEISKANREVAFAYDKVRRPELRRNAWKFAVKRTVLRAIGADTRLLVAETYDATKTYLPGAIVRDANRMIWTSDEPNNINNTPGDTDVWSAYYGPMTVSLYDSTTSYLSGELVYVLGATAGGYQVYRSLQDTNTDAPGTATAWAATTTYQLNDVVSSGGSQWRSLLPVNLNTTPADGPLDYAAVTTYSAAQTVTGSDHFIYSSVAGSNIGHDPVTDGGVHWTNTGVANAWSRTPTLIVSSPKWLPISATLANATILYPVGSGPVTQQASRNAFMLPAGFLRVAAQKPKQGSNSSLGAPNGLPYNDWELDGKYLVSDDTGPLVVRFVADVTVVSEMDDMFCEGLACRIATEVCETLTQSTTKLGGIASAYKLFMTEARMVNAVETGSDEPPLDDYINCRR